MRVGISQPCYLGWSGYFALIDACDTFVLLDSVSVSKQSWQNRNRIRQPDGRLAWLSIPTHAHKGQRLDEVRIDRQKDWQIKHWATITQSYSKATHFGSLDFLWPAYRWNSAVLLASYTSVLIRSIAWQLGITTRIIRATGQPPTRNDRHGRLEDLLQQLEATSYLSTVGATYLSEETHVGKTPVEWFRYEQQPYDQGSLPWQDHLSIIDLLAHTGGEALSVIRQGYAATV